MYVHRFLVCDIKVILPGQPFYKNISTVIHFQFTPFAYLLLGLLSPGVH